MSEEQSLYEDIYSPEDEFTSGLKRFKASDESKWQFQNKIIEQGLHFIDKSKNGTIHVATGGGKTSIANRLISRLREENDRDLVILWVTKDWRLLFQAAQNYTNLLLDKLNYKEYVSRFSGNGKELSFLDDENKCENEYLKDQVYTTIQSLAHPNNKWFFEENINCFDVVFIDECHWGYPGKLYNFLYKICKQNKIPVIGLSATPNDKCPEVIYKSISFDDLVKAKVLAKPNVIELATGSNWDLEIRNSLITSDSYKELALNSKRNHKIIKVLNKKDWGKTILFAINIEHANSLYELLEDSNFPRYIIHSHLTSDERRNELSKFRRERGKSVLINVEMATTGIDIGDVKSIFVTRPTTSPTLYSQMVGRGSRFQENKKSFNIVEFTDNYESHEEEIINATRYLKDEGGFQSTIVKRVHKNDKTYEKAKFNYEPSRFTNIEFSFGNERIILPINQNQTFGLEIELTKDGIDYYDDDLWMQEAYKIHKVLIRHLGDSNVCKKPEINYDAKLKYNVFNIIYDGSCGWEIVSPILKGQSGLTKLNELLRKCSKDLENMGFRVNFETGLHLHLGYKLPKGEKLRNLLHNMRFLSPYFSLLVSPSRVVEFDGFEYDLEAPNEFCKSIRFGLTEEDVEDINSKSDLEDTLEYFYDEEDDPRYFDFNFTNLIDYSKPNAIEIRLHNGSMNPKKILCWISLWMQLLETMKSNTEYLDNYIENEIPLPSKHIKDTFKDVMSSYLNNSSSSLINYLDQRSSKLWIDWKEIL